MSELVNAARLRASAYTLTLSAVQDETFGQVLDDVGATGPQLLKVEVLDALVMLVVGAGVLAIADLAHDHHFRTLVLDVLLQLRASHVLKLWPTANATAVFRAVKLRMHDEL